MTVLATVDDVTAILGTTPTDTTRLNRLITLASALIEDEVGRSLDTTPISSEIHSSPYRKTGILLNQWPVASVEEVREDGTVLTTDDWLIDLETGILRRAINGSAPAYWNSALSAVAIDYTPTVPEALTALAAGMVARAYRGGDNESAVPSVMGGLRQLTIGRWSATREGSTETRAGTALYLTDTELRIAHRWRDRWP